MLFGSSMEDSLVPLDRLERLDRAVAGLAATVRLLQALTPVNAREEHDRLGAAFAHGGEAMPRWRYEAAPPPADGAIAAVADAARRERSSLGHVYFARIEEIAIELDLQAAAGTPAVAMLSTKRFAIEGGAAEATAKRWVHAGAETSDAPRRATDDMHPSSLLGLLESEIGTRRLPFGVRVVDGLASLAATGSHNVYVSGGRLVTDAVGSRTAVHEIEGHVVPRSRARLLPLRLFFVGTAGGHDTQEGLALWHEERSELLDGERRFELGLRHLACEAMVRGADFVEVMRHLVRDLGAHNAVALGIAERIFRGSDGRSAGLGRERVYLPHFLRVRERLARRPEDAVVLGAGQLGLDVLDLAREILERAVA